MSSLKLSSSTEKSLASKSLTAVIIAGPEGKILDEKLYNQTINQFNRLYCSQDACTISPDNIAVAGEGEDFNRTFKDRLAGLDKYVPKTSIIGLVDKEGNLVASNVLELYPVQSKKQGLLPMVLNTYSMYNEGQTSQNDMILLNAVSKEASAKMYGEHFYASETNPRTVINVKGEKDEQPSRFGYMEASAKLGSTQTEFKDYVHDTNKSAAVVIGDNKAIAVQMKGGYIPVNLDSDTLETNGKIKDPKAAAALMSGFDEKGEARNGEHLLFAIAPEAANHPKLMQSVQEGMKNFYISVGTGNLGLTESAAKAGLKELDSYKEMQTGIKEALSPNKSLDTKGASAEEIARVATQKVAKG